MAYTLDFAVALGAGNTGLTLEAQLVDTGGVNVGAAITTGFVEFGATGNYLWHTTAIPDSHRGGAVFQVSPAGAIKAFAAINPQEAENVDAKVGSVGSALLKLDWTGLTGEASHSLLNAVRFLRNRFGIAAGVVTVYKEDGTTSAYTRTASTTAGADPVTAISD